MKNTVFVWYFEVKGNGINRHTNNELRKHETQKRSPCNNRSWNNAVEWIKGWLTPGSKGFSRKDNSWPPKFQAVLFTQVFSLGARTYPVPDHINK
jgi:hypothetical protein